MQHSVEALLYKPEGRGFDPDGEIILPAALWSEGQISL